VIILIGLPGSGKSTVGRQLARRLAFCFVDTDQRIEQRLECSIREFFEREGEERFRDIEEAVLDEVLSVDVGSSQVVATGGGVVLRQSNRMLLMQHTTIYLSAKPGDLLRRVQHDRTRPLLQTAQPSERLQELYQVRHPLYCEVARHVIETGHASANMLVERIMGLLGNIGSPSH
jgi:shikimate kinase